MPNLTIHRVKTLYFGRPEIEVDALVDWPPGGGGIAGYAVMLFQNNCPDPRIGTPWPLEQATDLFHVRNDLKARGYTHGLWMLTSQVTKLRPVRRPHPVADFEHTAFAWRYLPAYGVLELEDEGEEYDTYLTNSGEEVHLQHRTDRVLLDPDGIADPVAWVNAERERWGGQGYFNTWLKDQIIDPSWVDEYVKECGWCAQLNHEDNLAYTAENRPGACPSCIENHYRYCEECDELYPRGSFTTVVGDDVCSSCLAKNYRHCSDCDEWYHCEVNHRCESCCESPAQEFSLRNDGHEPLRNDVRVTVSLGQGVISDEGMSEITAHLRYFSQWAHGKMWHRWAEADARAEGKHEQWQQSRATYLLADEIYAGAIGNQWQAKTGNFTKRLSRYAYKTHQIKLPPEVISEVGNLASQHSQGADYAIEITRDLNLPREEFANPGSCWWTDYSYSRCTLKTNGGFALRTFDGDGRVKGRAWVWPLKYQEHLHYPARSWKPTFDTHNADGFVVFNGYGNLGGYAGARIIAQMTGLTYRRIEFESEHMYVNGESGYLVTREELADQFTDSEIKMIVDSHADVYEEEQESAEMAAADLDDSITNPTITSEELAHA